MKTSALAVGAVAVLSQGRALADEQSNTSSTLYHLETNRTGQTATDSFNQEIGAQISTIWAHNYESKLKWWTTPPVGKSDHTLTVYYCGEI